MLKRALLRVTHFTCVFAFAFGLLSLFSNAYACGIKSDCILPSGTYRAFLPSNHEGKKNLPAILYIHGLGGSAKRTIGRSDLRRVAKRVGAVLIASDGLAGQWTFKNGVDRGSPRNEFRYFSDLLADVVKRFPVDRNKIVVVGFSIGASMTWHLACSSRLRFAGFVTIAGTFWRPQPKGCSNQIGELYHYHGTADRTFPLSGRRVRNKHQGDIRDTFTMVYRQDSCSKKPVEELKFRGQRCTLHRNCSGEALQFCLNGSGHFAKAFYVLDGFNRIATARGW